MLYKPMLLKKFWTKSIGRQLMLGIVLVHAVLMSIFVIDLVGREKTFLIDLSQKQAIGLAQTLATNGSSWVLSQDFIGMEEVINSQSSFPDIKYALFLDTKLKVLAFTDSKKVGKYLDDNISKTLLKAKAKTHLLLDNFGYIDVAAPIMANNQHIGWARVGISRKGITNNIKHVTQKGIFYTLFAIVIGVIFAWFMSRSLTVDIRKLVSSANKLEAGESINFTLNREDELGQMADNFQSLNETLDDKVKTRTRQVTEANNKLEQTINELKKTQNELIDSEKMASLGRLVAGFAHELNTPLGVAIGSASMLQIKSKQVNELVKEEEVDVDELMSALETIDKGSELALSNLKRAANLVTSFKRTAIDQTSDELQSFYIHQVMNDIITTLNSKFKKTDISIQVNCPDDIKIKSLPGALEQILTNLLMNSYTHGFNEGKTSGTIQLKVQPDREQLHLEYSDNGKGVAPENLVKIFEPFFTTNRSGGGSGLGMYVCYNIVTTQLHGTLACESVVGEGVMFKINFPVEYR
ncbi:MAG: hypothetical protein KAG43_10185 [Candidatus Marithrix sp.]|nr:hypothetical protein [Candidatus Marithrix sp.]